MLKRMYAAVGVATLMLVFGLVQVSRQPDVNAEHYIFTTDQPVTSVIALLLATTAVVLAGRWPGVALALLWGLLAFHWLASTPFLLGELGVLFVAFACAAWGRLLTLGFSAVSIPLATAVGATYVFWYRDRNPGALLGQLQAWGLREPVYALLNQGRGPLIVVSVVVALLLSVPWLLGLLARALLRAEESQVRQAQAEAEREVAETDRRAAQAERDRAAEVARLQEAQTQLSRDVHDVVGHSLTVILAQAEAGQFGQDTAALKQTLATITDTARSSLTDVRQVLQQTRGAVAPLPVQADLEVLLDGVRAGGRIVTLTDEGTARPLPPDLAPVAHRVVQEMLTNAVRHGDPDVPIMLTRHWGDHLELEVTNGLQQGAAARAAAGEATAQGSGLEGMARRLVAVNGTLRVDPSPTHFIVRATMPLPGRQETTR